LLRKTGCRTAAPVAQCAAEGLMDNTTWTIRVEDADAAASARAAGALADRLREILGVESAERSKARDDTMDLGTIITVIASSTAAAAIAAGLADWLRARRGGTLDIDGPNGKLRATGLDQETLLKLAKHSVRP
jgi:hypothetical protein